MLLLGNLFVRLLPDRLRLEMGVQESLRPYVGDGLLPGVRVYLSDSFRQPKEAPQRAIARLRKVVDDAVRSIVTSENLRGQAPPTEVVLLDTVKSGLIDVQTFDLPIPEISSEPALIPAGLDDTPMLAAFCRVVGGTSRMDQTIEVAPGQEIGGPHAVPPTVPISESTVSARHAAVTIRRGSVAIADLGSRHGTWVRGERIGREGVSLRPGDRLRMGAAELEFIGLSSRSARKQTNLR